MFDMFSEDSTIVLRMLIFLAAAMVAFAVMIGIHARDGLRRRMARVNLNDAANNDRRSLQFSSARTAQRLIDYVTKHYTSADGENVKVLRRRMLQPASTTRTRSPIILWRAPAAP